MKKLIPLVAAFLFPASLQLCAQVLPATPKNFATRDISDIAKGGGSVSFTPAKPQTTVRTITHIVLGNPRQWKLSDGKFYLGKLIAFEDLVTEGNAAAAQPVVPKNPTVVRDGKARLLVNAKPFEIALDRFGDEERKFIESTRIAIAAKK